MDSISRVKSELLTKSVSLFSYSSIYVYEFDVFVFKVR